MFYNVCIMDVYLCVTFLETSERHWIGLEKFTSERGMKLFHLYYRYSYTIVTISG